MHPYLISITKDFEKAANALKAEDFHKYMMGNFNFFGIKTPLRRQICKTHFRNHSLKKYEELQQLVEEAWALDLREYQYYAIELIIANKKLWTDKTIELIDFCLSTKSWWDTVDQIDASILPDYFKIFPQHIQPYTEKWNSSDNIWLQRSSIVFQKNFKHETNTALLKKYIIKHLASEEFHVQKAIGWALRAYSKTNAEWVEDFINEHDLKPVSLREARKILDYDE
ncbi:MAG: DNA alkylation repair protein [Chitinophaga sp.]|jgi:3-methyladenine DNA glycosylase AlkD|nr:DNA alkylation repair protein [Chitinophaga sp.]